MRTFQVTYLIGNLGRDPEMRYTGQGAAVTTLSVAVGRTRKGTDGTPVEETEWFRVVLWEKLAETANEYLRKGNAVYVEGRLQSRKYTDKEGIERASIEVVAQDFVMLGGRSEGDKADEFDDEVPF